MGLRTVCWAHPVVLRHPHRHRVAAVAASITACAIAATMEQDGATIHPRIAASATGVGIPLELLPPALLAAVVVAARMDSACVTAAATELAGAMGRLTIATCAQGFGITTPRRRHAVELRASRWAPAAFVGLQESEAP